MAIAEVDKRRLWRVRLDGKWLAPGDAYALAVEVELEDYTHEVEGAATPYVRPTGRRRALLRNAPVAAPGGDPDGWREDGDWLVIE